MQQTTHAEILSLLRSAVQESEDTEHQLGVQFAALYFADNLKMSREDRARFLGLLDIDEEREKEINCLL